MSYIYENFTEEEIEKLYNQGAEWHPSGAVTINKMTQKDYEFGVYWWMDLISDEKWVKSDWTCDELIEALDTDIKNGLRFDQCHEKYCVPQS